MQAKLLQVTGVEEAGFLTVEAHWPGGHGVMLVDSLTIVGGGTGAFVQGRFPDGTMLHPSLLPAVTTSGVFPIDLPECILSFTASAPGPGDRWYVSELSLLKTG